MYVHGNYKVTEGLIVIELGTDWHRTAVYPRDGLGFLFVPSQSSIRAIITIMTQDMSGSTPENNLCVHQDNY